MDETICNGVTPEQDLPILATAARRVNRRQNRDQNGELPHRHDW
jgi:hypothetical protein